MDPERAQNQKDDLYKPLIWALSIGIIVILTTLFLTRPAPESFTEIYINNHVALPEFVQLNQKYPYSFTIHNLENTQKEYNFTLTTELYNFDYSCERPDLWLEENKTQTTDPALYIKEDAYSISMNYELIKSDYIIIGLEDGYKIKITDQTVTYNNQTQNIKLNNTRHNLKIDVNNLYTNITLDNNNIFFRTTEKYTKGYPYIETGYAQITNFQIYRHGIKQNVNIRTADAKYSEIPFARDADTGIVILYSKYLSTRLYEKVVKEPVIMTEKKNNTLNYYYSKEDVNMTSYTMTASYRIYSGSIIEIGYEDALEITHKDGKLYVGEKGYDITQNANSQIRIVVKDTMQIYYNDKKITELQKFTGKPYIKAYNGAVVSEFTVQGNDEPITIKYTFPDRQAITYSGIYTLSTINTIKNMTKSVLSENITEEDIESGISTLNTLYDREKINWTNYRLTATYQNRNKANEFVISYGSMDKEYYRISIKNNTAKINNTGYNVTEYLTNRIAIDVNNGTATFYLNDHYITKIRIEQSEGVILYEYPGITLINAQIENKDTNKVRVYKRQVNIECEPTLIHTYEYKDSKILEDKQSLMFNAFFEITEPFDIAKVQATLDNGQEVHFWIRQK